MMHNLIIANSM